MWLAEVLQTTTSAKGSTRLVAGARTARRESSPDSGLHSLGPQSRSKSRWCVLSGRQPSWGAGRPKNEPTATPDSWPGRQSAHWASSYNVGRASHTVGNAPQSVAGASSRLILAARRHTERGPLKPSYPQGPLSHVGGNARILRYREASSWAGDGKVVSAIFLLCETEHVELSG
jgi:hypothetical protein